MGVGLHFAMSHLILASGSPQRKRLLEEIGIEFKMCPSVVDESSCTERDPQTRAGMLALMKAKDVRKRFPGDIILGCDTLVVTYDGVLLEKPRDTDDARRMMMLQSGKISTVHSGLCVLSPDREYTEVDSPRVFFKPFHDDDIAWWIGSGKWEGGSGAFRVEEFEERGLIERIEGDRTAVIGLPMTLLHRLLNDFDIVPSRL